MAKQEHNSKIKSVDDLTHILPDLKTEVGADTLELLLREDADGRRYLMALNLSTERVVQADVELFGYRTEYIGRNRNREKDRYYNVITTEAAAVADVDGLVQRNPDDPKKPFQWLVTVRDKDSKRFGVLGFASHWRSDYHAANYQASKAYVFADRPIYRPDQKVPNILSPISGFVAMI